MTAPPMPESIDRYALEELLGAGAMGTVYLAFDTRLRRRVAIKVLAPVAQALGGDAVQAALREARAAGAISHPNAAAVYDADERDGRAFIVMEPVIGTPLRRFVGDAAVPVALRIRWLVDVAGALAAAHEVGVIHRDVKPENVVVREDGVVKVLDFGLARRAMSDGPEQASHESWSKLGHGFVGTPGYIAPELLRGQPIDGRADQFAWGVVAYELLSGSSPWQRGATPFTALAAVLTQDAPPLGGDLPPEITAAVRRALSKAPDARFASLALAAAALAPFAEAPPKSFRAPQVAKLHGPPPPAAQPIAERAVELSPLAGSVAPRAPLPALLQLDELAAPPLAEEPRRPPPAAPEVAPRPRPGLPEPPPELARPRLARPIEPPAPRSRPGVPEPPPELAPPRRAPPPSRPDGAPWPRPKPPSEPDARRRLGFPSRPDDPLPSSRRAMPSRQEDPSPRSRPGSAPDGPVTPMVLGPGFHRPRFDTPVDLDGHLRLLPPGATCKGMFFIDLFARLGKLATARDLAIAAGVPERRYVPFLSYPMEDMMRLEVAAARVLHPRLPVGEGLRRGGQRAFDLVLDTVIGRALLAVAGRDVATMLLRSARAYRSLTGIGALEVKQISPLEFHIHAREMPLFLETYQVGVLEGTLRHCNVRGDIWIEVRSLAEAIVVARLR